MARTETYQLRLTKEEKDRLGEEARDKGCSMAVLLRGRIFKYGEVLAKGKTAAGIHEDRKQSLIARLKNQGYTTPVAERMAKERLDG